MEREAHAGAGLLAGLVTLWGPTLEQPVPEGLRPVGGTHAGAGTECEASSPEEEGAAETACDELTATRIPRPPALLGGKG